MARTLFFNRIMCLTLPGVRDCLSLLLVLHLLEPARVLHARWRRRALRLVGVNDGFPGRTR